MVVQATELYSVFCEANCEKENGLLRSKPAVGETLAGCESQLQTAADKSNSLLTANPN